MAREWMWRGKTMDELESMSLGDFADLLPSNPRRHIIRGFSDGERKLLRKIRRVSEEEKSEARIRTHAREMVILPEMVGLTINVHNGVDFEPVEIEKEMIGRRLGEFVPTNKIVKHGMPGVGATRSSLYVPLK